MHRRREPVEREEQLPPSIVNPESERLLQAADIPQGFLERQQFFQQAARQRGTRKSCSAEEAECTFSPNIGKAAHVLAASRCASGCIDLQQASCSCKRTLCVCCVS